MKILTVCLGNICRSPVAHGILERLSKEQSLDWTIDSAGTSAYHVGEPPCEGSIDVCKNQGIDISHLRSRQVVDADYTDFDLILAMDSSNYSDLRRDAPNLKLKDKVKLVLNYSQPGINRSVPDSYYTGNYQEVYDLLYDACLIIVDTYKS